MRPRGADRRALYFFFGGPNTSLAIGGINIENLNLNKSVCEKTTCHEWFRRFKDGDFDVHDRPREGRPSTFEDAELEALLDEDPCKTQ